MPHKVCVVLGEATGFYNEYGVASTRKALRDGYGSHATHEFQTEAELKAYLQGLHDMSGLEDYEMVSPSDYQKMTKEK